MIEIKISTGTITTNNKKRTLWQSNDKKTEILFDKVFYRVITRNNDTIDTYRVYEEMDNKFIEEWVEKTIKALNYGTQRGNS